jgi:3-deoxy-D-manno-octulosonate 8-phosphate phosphatase (KDO 8-P phosphatase)
VAQKADAYEAIRRQAGLEDAAIAFMGDDLLDLPVLSRVGLSAAPADGAAEVRAAVDWVSRSGGGRGAVRELIELVLRAQGRWDEVVQQYGGRALSER